MFALIFVWLEVRARSFTKKGIVFDDPSLKYQLSPEELPNPDEEKDLPNVIVAILPIILILVLFNNPMHPFPVETSVFAGVALATILMFKRIKGVNAWIGVFNKGAADSGVAIPVSYTHLDVYKRQGQITGQVKNTPQIIFGRMEIIISQIFIDVLKNVFTGEQFFKLFGDGIACIINKRTDNGIITGVFPIT